jgi:Ubiquitin C-terminal hydrolase
LLRTNQQTKQNTFQIRHEGKEIMKDNNHRDPVVASASVVGNKAPSLDNHQDDHVAKKKIEILSNFLSKAHSLKQQGNVCFSRKDFQTAQSHYAQALKIVNQILRNACRSSDAAADKKNSGATRSRSDVKTKFHLNSCNFDDSKNLFEISCNGCWDEGLTLDAEKLLVSLVGNQAITLYKLANYDDAIECCNGILGSVFREGSSSASMMSSAYHPQLQPPQQFHFQHDVSKVYYRRALAKEALRQYDLALKDITACLEYLSRHKSSRGNDSSDGDGGDDDDVCGIESPEEIQKQQRQLHDAKVALERIQAKVDAQLSQHDTNHDVAFQSQIGITSLSSSRNNGFTSHPNQSLCPDQLTQRDIVHKLLQQSSVPKMGELFCLIDFTWWKKWCLYVDFYSIFGNFQQQGTEWLRLYRIPSSSSSRLMKSHDNTGTWMDGKGRVLQGNDEEEEDDDVYMMDESDGGISSNGSFQDSCNDSTDDTDCDSDDNDKDDDHIKNSRRNKQIQKPSAIDNCRLFMNPNCPTDQFLKEWNSNHGMEMISSFPASHKSMQLKSQLVRGHHFEILPREVYSALKSWYGESTPTIMRRAMVVPPRYRSPVVFLYPRRNNIGMPIQLFPVDPTVYDPRSGRIGLTNLGNTCFMNAALQCLSHATPLTRYFLMNHYEGEINTTNPIGTGGKLAVAYEAMIRQLWIPSKRQTSFSPRGLKRAIALFAPRFAGTMQQDSQEFLAFFLDGLHEDLNRVKNPPYVEKADVTHEHDLNVAGAEAWDAHCRRNQSIVMDTFYGQFKSTCICPNCKQISVSFDAFNHVSLEIPQLSNFGTIVVIVLFRADLPAEPPQQYGILVPKHAQISDVKQQLSALSQIPTERLAICDIYESNIYEIIHDNKSVTALNHDDVTVAYEIDPYTNRTIHAIATHVLLTGETEYSTIRYPLFLSFSVTLTCRQVNQYIKNRLEYIIPESATFQVKLVENDGTPMPVFPNMLPSGQNSFSSVIPDSEDIMTSFLNDDCAESYLFMKIEWITTNNSSTMINFEKYTNHPSLNEAILKHRSMLNKTPTLDQCLENFTQPERLDEDNKWYCSRCKDHVRAEKKMTLWRLPNILVIHLKRFEFRNALRREKLDSFVDFPLDGLDMSKYCGSLSVPQNDGNAKKEFVVNDIPAIYDLFGVVNHYGRMGFGHYTAFARRWNEYKIEDQWMLFDDSSVRDGISRAEVVSNAGYILFYRRRDFA